MATPPANVSWTCTFFSGAEPPFEAREEPQGLSTFRHFPVPDKRWIFGRRLSEANGSPIVVFRLYSKEEGVKRSFAAKAFPEHTIDDAQAQWYRIPSTWFTTKDIKDEFDEFLCEARAFEQIDRECSEAEKIYFPRYHGILTPIDPYKFNRAYQPRNQAIVLESLRPDTTSRRILSAPTPNNQFEKALEFPERLQRLDLTQFEQDWYTSLVDNRLRRVNVLHNIGIVHFDIADRHFRLPGDFYDTVLYDFSVAYTFSGKWPYKYSIRLRYRPQELKAIRENEQWQIAEHVFSRYGSRCHEWIFAYSDEARAENMDFRKHIASAFNVSVEEAVGMFSSLDKAGNLELILLKVMHRPDEFSMSSLSSVFPFLEAICPKDDPAWCIRRTRQLKDYYDFAWVMSGKEEGCPSEGGLSMVCCRLPDGQSMLLDIENMVLDRDAFFLLLLIPTSWEVEDMVEKLLRCSTELIDSGESVGVIIGRDHFDHI